MLKNALLGLIVLFMLNFRAHAEEPLQVSNIHRTITKQTGWLNTSRPIVADDLKGRIILLDFWTFCCINCMHVIPDLKYLEEKFGDDLTVIGVHSAKFKNERDTENIRQAILRYGIHHPVVNDFDFSTWQAFGIRAWPTFVLINPRGTIEQLYSGEGNRQAAERDIAELLKKYEGRINREKLPMALEEAKAPATILKFPSKFAYLPSPFSGRPGPIAVSDSGHHQIKFLMPGTSYTSSVEIFDRIGSGQEGFKDGSFEEAEFRRPQGILYAPSGDEQKNGLLYIADTENHAIRVADLDAGTVTTIAGTGKQGYERNVRDAAALSTPLASPWDLVFYPDEKHIAIAMAGTHQLWSYDIETKTVSVIAGNGRESIDDGKYPYNSLSQPSGLSAYDGKLYFVDSETSSLRVLENGEVKTLIGTGLFDFGYQEGKRGEARMQHPLGVLADHTGVYIADSYNHSIRRYDPKTGLLSNFAGHGERGTKDGRLKDASFNEPNAIIRVSNALFITDTNNNALRVIDLGSDKVTTLKINEAEKQAAPEFSDTLPNLQSLPPVDAAAGKPIEVIFTLQKGWKINEEAPSYLALFDMKGDKHSLVASFDLAAVKAGRITLPALESGTYRLNGTLYYCEETEGAQCLIKSFNLEITPKEKGVTEITLPVN